MKKIALIVGALVVVGLIVWGIYTAATGGFGTTAGDFSVQTLQDRGTKVKYLMSKDSYGHTALIKVPAQDTTDPSDTGIWTIENTDGMKCFTVDEDHNNYATSEFPCPTGTTVKSGMIFSIGGPNENMGFKLHQP